MRDALDREGVRYFTNILIDNTLMIYYRDLYNEAQQDVYEKLHRSPYRNFVKRPVPEGEKVIYFMILEKDSRTAEIYGKLREQPWSGSCRIRMYASHDYPGYAYMKIYSREATREHMLRNLTAVSYTHLRGAERKFFFPDGEFQPEAGVGAGAAGTAEKGHRAAEEIRKAFGGVV